MVYTLPSLNSVNNIDLVLIDQQSVGKRSLHPKILSMRKRDGRPFTGMSTNS
jgi:hypothetical protein